MKNETKQQRFTMQDYICEGTESDIRDRYNSLIAYAEAIDFDELDDNIVVLDTETTGFSYNHDELIQIAAARIEKGKISSWFVTFVNPGKPIPEEIIHLTHIKDEDVANAPSPEDALAQLVEFVGTSDIIAHNAEFDRAFTTKYMYGKPLEQNLWIDSLDLARIGLPRLKSHRLLDLARAFEAPISTHRADADVETLCTVYRILLASISIMPKDLVAEVASFADEQEWPSVKIFKYFAQKNAEQSSKALSDKEKNSLCEDIFQEKDQSRQENFNLLNLRKKRITLTSRKAKRDADDIAADPLAELAFPQQKEIESEFEKNGTVGRLYENYETRYEQAKMAEEINQAFSTSSNLVVEAGTGVGKSMAYLLPAALTAKKNNIGIGVATKTNALLDQLIYKELPLLAKALESRSMEETPSSSQDPTFRNNSGDKAALETSKELTFSSLKGFSHYACLYRINRILTEGLKTKSIMGKELLQAPHMAALLSFIEQSLFDDIDTLKIDYRVLTRQSITTTSRECLRRRCPFYSGTCFVHGARRRAETADIVVTNHSLLFCDIASDAALLPPIRYWVIDEAHGAETEARRAFSLELSADEIARVSRRVSADDSGQNSFIRAERRLGVSVEENTLWQSLFSKARSAGKEFDVAAQEFTRHIKDLAFFDSNKRSKGYELLELWINEDIRGSETFKSLMGYGKIFCDATERLIKACQEIVNLYEEAEEGLESQREISSISLTLKEMLNTAETILFKAPTDYAYSASLSKKSDKVAEKLHALLINVGEKMNETFYANTHSVIFTSATLTVDNSFEAFETALGLNKSEFSYGKTCQLASSYDFDTNMTIYVVDDIPEPNDPTYLAALQRLLIAVHRSQQGSLLTLFTNRKEMEKCFDAVQPILKQVGLRLVCQKWGTSFKNLRDEFLADEHLSLFALKSFWEGFDAPGTTLKGVIIPKLPFTKPTDPLSCERAIRDNQAWSRYVLPAAVLETKQAAGRLIRGSEDKGSLILTDRRLLTKGYGKAFLNSLPSRTIKVCSSVQVAEELEAKAATSSETL